MAAISVWQKPGSTEVLQWLGNNESEFQSYDLTTTVLSGGELKITIPSGYQIVPLGYWTIVSDSRGFYGPAEFVFDITSLTTTFWLDKPYGVD